MEMISIIGRRILRTSVSPTFIVKKRFICSLITRQQLDSELGPPKFHFQDIEKPLRNLVDDLLSLNYLTNIITKIMVRKKHLVELLGNGNMTMDEYSTRINMLLGITGDINNLKSDIYEPTLIDETTMPCINISILKFADVSTLNLMLKTLHEREFYNILTNNRKLTILQPNYVQNQYWPSFKRAIPDESVNEKISNLFSNFFFLGGKQQNLQYYSDLYLQLAQILIKSEGPISCYQLNLILTNLIRFKQNGAAMVVLRHMLRMVPMSEKFYNKKKFRVWYLEHIVDQSEGEISAKDFTNYINSQGEEIVVRKVAGELDFRKGSIIRPSESTFNLMLTLYRINGNRRSFLSLVRLLELDEPPAPVFIERQNEIYEEVDPLSPIEKAQQYVFFNGKDIKHLNSQLYANAIAGLLRFSKFNLIKRLLAKLMSQNTGSKSKHLDVSLQADVLYSCIYVAEALNDKEALLWIWNQANMLQTPDIYLLNKLLHVSKQMRYLKLTGLITKSKHYSSLKIDNKN